MYVYRAPARAKTRDTYNYFISPHTHPAVQSHASGYTESHAGRGGEDAGVLNTCLIYTESHAG